MLIDAAYITVIIVIILKTNYLNTMINNLYIYLLILFLFHDTRKIIKMLEMLKNIIYAI